MTNYKKILAVKFNLLASKLGLPTSRKQAIETGAKQYLHLDNYPMYGGYNLIMVDVKSGGHNSFGRFPSCGNRQKAEVMCLMIDAFVNGLEYENDKAQGTF